jgi:ATP-dependent Lon protease
VMNSTETLDALDQKANAVFPGKVVRKDLVRRVKVGANVPVYVLEYLIGKYCASDDPQAVEVGLRVVNETLAKHFIRPDEAQKAQASLKRRGQHRIIDKVKVRLVASEDKFWAELANFGDKYVHVPEDLVYQYDRLLQGGVWAQADLVYDADEEELHKRPFFIKSLRPIQVATFSMDEYRNGRSGLSREEWMDVLIRSIGMEPSYFDQRLKLLLLTRLIPMVERNYNLIELGPRGTGKSFVYRETSPNAILISGGKTTVPQLFVHLGTGRVGLIGTWDVVAFDEVAGIQFTDPSGVQMLKDYMESGSFARGKEELPAEASLVFLGNLDLPADVLVRTEHLFHGLPKAMIDPAFLDRLHFYFPGWEVPKLEQRFFADHYGFVSDYLAEALRELRRVNYADVVEREFAFGAHLNARDEKAVKKTVSGLLKLLHPHGEWSRTELREYFELALEGRRRVKEQLRKLAPHEYAKTDFSYVERDTGRETWVQVPEQPVEDLEEQIEQVASARPQEARPPSEGLSSKELIALGETATMEFKASARWNYERGEKDRAVEEAVVKTVAGFMNARGGTLLIGVNDSGEPIGLDHDWKTLQRRDRDGYENWLTTLFEHTIGKPAIVNLSISFEDLNGQDVCRIDVDPSRSPVFVERRDETWFYVRLNNSTRRLNTKEALEYISARWGGPEGSEMGTSGPR